MVCAIFDLDDTLYLERDYVRSGFHAAGMWARRELGVPDFSERALREFECGRRADIFDRVLDSYGLLDCNAVARLVQVYRSHTPSITLLPDAIQCLNALRSRCHLALITDGRVVQQQNKLRALELDTGLDLVVLTDKWGREFWKPNLRAFNYVQQQFAVSPDSCVYIADNPAKDFVGPRRLGWRTIRIRRENGLHRQHSAQESYAADREVADLCEVPAMLLNG
jgi:putative hydrolase of the HAD superfamily